MGLEQAKEILLANQYPSNLIEEIFNKTLYKIIENNSDSSEPTDLDKSVNLDPNCCLHNISEKEKFMFFVNYRGKPTEYFAQALRRLNAPCKLIMTLHKTKEEISKLKTPVPHMLQNNVVYQIICPGCNASYVGQTSRLLQQRFKEHVGPRGIITNHFEECNQIPTENDVKVLGKHKGEKLLTLEALYINKIKPTLNSKDEYRSRVLKLKF